jgi:hypothetical protein
MANRYTRWQSSHDDSDEFDSYRDLYISLIASFIDESRLPFATLAVRREAS